MSSSSSTTKLSKEYWSVAESFGGELDICAPALRFSGPNLARLVGFEVNRGARSRLGGWVNKLCR